MGKSKIPILFVELVPSTCHYSNVRSTVKPKEWDKIRFLSYEAAKYKCEICSDTGEHQGYGHDLECHEIWEYDDENHIQKLVGLISLCPRCHQIKHIGRSIAIGKQKECYAHMAKVNGWSKEDIDLHVKTSFLVYAERSKHQWHLDLSLLTKEPYNLILKEGKRIFGKKYKKRRRSKRKVAKKLNKRPNRK